MWEGLWSFLNSNFSAAFFGACAGAWAAHFIGTRGERKKELLREIRSTDAAISLAFNVIGRAISLKVQNVQETVGSYRLRRNSVHAHVESVQTRELPPGTEIRVQIDLKRLDPLRIPVERLETVVLEEVSVRGRVPQLAITLGQCLAALNESIEQRNDLIADFKAWEAPEREKAMRFFGLPYGDRQFDTSFGDTLAAIELYTDNCIWFGKRLCRDLEKHAVGLRVRFKKDRFRGEVRKVVPVDFSKAEADGLFPSDEQYSDWESSFVTLVPPSSGRYFEKLLYAVRSWCRWPWRVPRCVRSPA
jgi:hypothetical protein